MCWLECFPLGFLGRDFCPPGAGAAGLSLSASLVPTWPLSFPWRWLQQRCTIKASMFFFFLLSQSQILIPT